MKSEDSFSRYVFLSIAAHIGLVLIFSVKMAFFPSEDVNIKNAIRVDVVALPEKQKARPKPAPKKKKEPKVEVKKKAEKKPEPKPEPEPKPKPKPEPEPEPKVAKEPSEDTTKEQEEALNRLKQLQDQAKKEEESAPEKKEYKGNILNPGESLTGLAKMQFEAYFQKLQVQVKDNWDLPQWLANKGLKAQALVRIDERGFVVERKIIKSSNNEIFDDKVLTTVDRASPLPKPPGRLETLVETNGIVFNFP